MRCRVPKGLLGGCVGVFCIGLSGAFFYHLPLQTRVPYLGLLSLFFYVYSKTVFTEPGNPHPALTGVKLVPYAQAHDHGDGDGDGKGKGANGAGGDRVVITYESKKRNGQARYCRICKIYKPDRVHHCHSCGQCRLKMDHHCVYLNNCIALHTHKFFLLFLFYGSATCWYTASMLALTSKGMLIDGPMPRLLTFGTALVFALVLTIFGLFQLGMCTLNMTTIEWVEKKGGCCGDGTHNGAKFRNIYYQSIFTNLCQILGPFWQWLLPVPPNVLDGLSYPVNRRATSKDN